MVLLLTSYHDCYSATRSLLTVQLGQLIMGRNLKSRFDLLKPNLVTRVEQKQQQQKQNHDAHAVSCQFQVE